MQTANISARTMTSSQWAPQPSPCQIPFISEAAYGHTGAGGSAHGAWPRHRTGFSYCMNEMRPELSDQRARRLLRALYTCLPATA